MLNSLNNKKKIIQVIGRLDSGGAERVFVDICNVLYKERVVFDVLFTREEGLLSKFLNSKIKKISLERKYRWSFLSIIKIIKVLYSYEIIHVHLRHNFFYIKIITDLYPFKKWDVIFHDHHGDIDIDNSIPFLFKIIRNDYTYIGVSKSLENWARKNLLNLKAFYSLPNVRLNSVTNGMKDIISPIKQNKKMLNIVHVSNIRKTKNIEFALKLIKQLKKNRKVSLTIYGAISDKIYFSKLKTMVVNLDLSKDVSFIHDELDVVQVLKFYDFGIYSSISESGPLVLIEYLSSGIPFISYKTGEVVSTIVKRFPMFIMDNFHVKNWIDQIDNILDENIDKNLLIDFCKKEFSEKNFSLKLIDIFRSV